MRKSLELLFVAILVAIMAIIPLFGLRALVQDLFMVLCLLVLALNWNMLAGFAGLVSVGQQLFVGVGAYSMFAAVILWGIDPLTGAVIGGLVAMALSVPVAFFTFRLNGAYFAIATWAVAEIGRLSIGQWRALGGGTGTALPRGAARDMPGVQLLRDVLDISGAAAVDVLTYWLALGLVVVMLVASWLFLRSRMGLGLQAMRDNPVAARSVGVDAVRLKALVFLLTAFGTGLCGALIFIQTGRIAPDAAFSVIDWTAFVIFIVVIGGIGTLPGPIVGVLVFYGLQRLLSDYGTVYLIVLGVIGIVIMLFEKRGLWGGLIQRTGFDLLSLEHIPPGPGPDKRTTT
ncbi:branched-chain amino acid ABC transporter permease (plasmid) [Martelella lutilitoris]|uniref:Branched-chain amino acid ABC transporter permease n=1 Tax=Martelella lutilitoris TaxID=2583532 RepID=A0A7T7HPM8_9HYPH|nr:branched-chain amino acid ABC transporter permease [Martelella lutilitoris]QQM32999.1 branched-chain amino acid ABC transporter permease [Martelella lutilitoris]QRX65341.1 branched-chain amino acid ABC transporter permease [Dysgonomonadaceae bacterium zrk40]